METIYFLLFCLANAFIVFWCLKYDDQADFQGQKRDTKFTPVKKKKEEIIPDDI